MLTLKAVADLSARLAMVTSPDAAQESLWRAVAAAGLSESVVVDERDLMHLLPELASEGGAIEQVARAAAAELATEGLGLVNGEGIAGDLSADDSLS